MAEKTVGDMFKDALKCITQAQGEAWLDREAMELAVHPDCKHMDNDAIKDLIRQNLGYMAGYYDQATSQKVYDLFGALHPVFGEPDYWEKVSAADAFVIGEQMAKEWREKKNGSQ